MWRHIKSAFLVAAIISIGTTVSDNDANYLFKTNRLPDKSVTPTLANGNLAFVVYGDAVHMNGIYNGKRGVSHRARIPNYANIQIAYCASSSIAVPTNPSSCSYQLDMKNNMFRTVYENPQRNFRVEHEVYPHRYFDQAIVNRIRIQRINSQAEVRIPIVRRIGQPSIDFSFVKSRLMDIDGEMFTSTCGRTIEVEDKRYQKNSHRVCIYYPQLPSHLTLPEDKTTEEFNFFTVFSRKTADAEQEIRAMKGSEIDLLHFREMERVWNQYGITVEGNDVLDRVLKASSFYLSSSLPSANTNQPSSYPFYGLSPSGLGRGGEELKEYQGHGFWDTEMWMYPVILLMDPRNARKLLRYRSVVQRAAADRAAENGFEGWQFPWESAFTGVDVTPDCCPDIAKYQLHITADVAYAARLYYYATEDVDWMHSEGCLLAYETAKFWRSRVEYNEQTDLYELNGIMGPDEYNPNVNNNPFTNVVAAHSLLFGEFASCLCSGDLGATCRIVASFVGYHTTQEDRRQFTQLAKGMTLPYDAERDFHPQFTGYTLGTKIKQADVVLLGYPLEYPIQNSTKANNLNIYSKVTHADGPAMTWAIHTVGHLDLNQLDEAEQTFHKSYHQYMRAPFNVWSENGDASPGAGNFITGAGGFLQSIINGYAGVRLRHGELVITNPRLLPQTTRLYIPEINYMSAKFFLDVTSTEFKIGFKPDSDIERIEVFVDGQKQELCETCSFTFKTRVVIRPARPANLNGCKLQQTKIGIRTAEQHSAVFVNQATPLVLVALLAFLLYICYIIRPKLYAISRTRLNLSRFGFPVSSTQAGRDGRYQSARKISRDRVD